MKKSVLVAIIGFLFLGLALSSNIAHGGVTVRESENVISVSSPTEDDCQVVEIDELMRTRIEIVCRGGHHYRFWRNSVPGLQDLAGKQKSSGWYQSNNYNKVRSSYLVNFVELNHIFPEIARFNTGNHSPPADFYDQNSPESIQIENDGWQCYHEGGPTCYGDFSDIEMVGPDEAWAVDESGIILHYENDKWSIAYSSPSESFASLTAISMLSSKYGWAVGYSQAGEGKPLALMWDGSSWQEMAVPSEDFLYDVDVVSENEVWTAGYSFYFGFHGSIARWNGNTWETVEELPLRIERIKMLSSNEGWVIGSDYSSSIIGRWDGSEWKNSKTLTDETLVDFDFEENEGWAIGGNNNLLHWDGAKWENVDNPSFSPLVAVDIVTADDVWLMDLRAGIHHWNGQKWDTIYGVQENIIASISMYSASAGFAAGRNGSLLRFSDDQWTSVGNSYIHEFVDLSMLGENEGWAAANSYLEGFILRYDGADWKRVYKTDQYYLTALDMVTSEEGWAAGYDYANANNTILHWTGEGWEPVKVPPSAEGKLFADVKMLSSDKGWIVGHDNNIGALIILQWNGEEWTVMSDAFNEAGFLGFEIKVFSENDIWIVGQKSVPDEGFCEIGLGGTFAFPFAIHWDGNDWQEIPPTNDVYYCGLPLYAIDGANPTDIWTSYRFRWDGSAWSGLKNSTFADWFFGLEMLSEDDGWSVFGYTPYHLFRYAGEIRHWDGTAWIESIIPTPKGLGMIDMVSPNEGWAVGDNAILHFKGEPPARNYYFLPYVSLEKANP